MTRNRPLCVEHLEERLTPATSGVTWPDGSHLTLSFVPDGTSVGSASSSLFATLNQTGSTAAWQQAILKAFQSWAAPANLNVGVVADGGQPLGTSGAVQGDSRFGDIRIAAAPLAAGTLITNTAFQWSGTTWSGDVVVNSSYLFSLGGGGNTFDLYTSMLNEAANVFGVLDTHTDTASGVYYQYVGVKSGLDANDVADIQSLYGIRSPDQYDATRSNSTLASATNLGIALTGVNLQADVTTPTDVDYYKFSVPLIAPAVVGLKVQLTTSGLSTLVGNLQVFNAAGQLVGSAAATDPLHGDLTVSVASGGLGGLLTQLLGGGTYYVRVAGNGDPAFGVGGYKLNVSFQLSNGTILGALSGLTGGLLDAESGLNDALNTAVQLPSGLVNGNKPDARFNYTTKASISSSQDVDYYKVQAPVAAGQKLNVIVWALEPNGLLPRLDVYDANGVLVPSTLLANENGTFSVEVDNAVAGGVYYVKVSALTPTGERNTGNYFLGVDFNTQLPTTLTTFAAGGLSATQPQTTRTMTIGQNQLDEFILAASAAVAATVEMDIFDASGNLVFTLRAIAGQPASTSHVYLKAGTYSVTFTATAPPGSSPPPVNYTLTGQLISDPIAPQRDTIASPATTTKFTSSGITAAPPTTTATLYNAPYFS
jgi:hypothetical protein